MLRPSVLVFDDSTAAIDAGTEQRIRAAMKRFAKDRVTLIISHRLSSLMHADQILFVEDGRIVERGTHEELLALGGRYRALYDLQLRPDDDRPRRRESHDVDAQTTTRRTTRSGRPTKAVVGSHRDEEEVFGKAYDPRIVRRIWSFVQPYQGRIFISVAAVLVFTLTQLAIPLIIRYAIDHGMAAGRLDRSVLTGRSAPSR